MSIMPKSYNPYILAVAFFISLLVILFCGNSMGIISNDIFLSLVFGDITILLSIIMAINAHRQSEIQRNNIKLQLFEKRYEVFRVIADSYLLITIDDITDDLISGKYNSIGSLYQDIGTAKEDMRRMALVSQCLFEKSMVEKIIVANVEFAKFCKAYYSYVRLLNSTLDESQIFVFKNLYSKFIATQGDEREGIAEELTKTFPQIYNCLKEINQNAADAYERVVETGLFDDFDKYIKIDNIDN